MTGPSGSRLARWGLPAILALYLILGCLYAVFTPPWQSPDEPAHYNYIRYLSEQHRFPVLVLGDYPAAYLEEIKAGGFPPDMTIAPIRYEFHQPPLYYLLATPVYTLFRGALLPVRLLSVAMGAVLLLVLYWAMRELAPQQPPIALGTVAFVAFLPMHLAMTAAANNDVLAELLMAMILLLAIRYLKRAALPPDHAADLRLLVLLGVTTGLGFLTKTSVYSAVPVVILAVLARHLWLDPVPPSWKVTVRSVVAYLLPAILLGLPWWARNMAVYGRTDWLGLGRHEQVVAGQLRTAEFVAQHGFGHLIHDFLFTSFRSFWGQFGWMGVVLDQRLYQFLAILSAVAVIGFALWARRAWRGRGTADLHPHAKAEAWQWAAGGLLAASALLTVASYLWYNTGFVQHQGRYLFPALLPIGLAVALGWREALRRRHAWLLAALLLLSAPVLASLGARSTWLILMLVGAAAALVIRRFLPLRWDPFVQLCPYLLLVPLDVVCLFLFVLPQLRR